MRILALLLFLVSASSAFGDAPVLRVQIQPDEAVAQHPGDLTSVTIFQSGKVAGMRDNVQESLATLSPAKVAVIQHKVAQLQPAPLKDRDPTGPTCLACSYYQYEALNSANRWVTFIRIDHAHISDRADGFGYQEKDILDGLIQLADETE